MLRKYRLLSLAALLSTTAAAEELPLWEVAVGAGALTIPEYRGSEEQKNLAFPFLYPTYRGEFLRVDDDGIKGIVYDSKTFEFDFSVDANTSVNSNDTETRRGMPDLDATLQVGPLGVFKLVKNPERRHAFFLNVPARAVFAVDFDAFEHVGYTFSPHFTYYKWFDFGGRTWRMGLSSGLEFGSDEYHDYYYQVEPRFATAARPAFDASGGYGGTRSILTLISRTRKSWISLFARYDDFSNATFEDSPLVTSGHGLTVGFIYSRILMRSKKTVEIERF